MKKSRIIIVAPILMAVTLLAFPQETPAQVVLIDFDTDPSGNPIAAGTVLTHVYSAMGITLLHAGSSDLCGSQIFANSNHPGDFGSNPNVVSTCGDPLASDISEAYGFVEVILDSPATSVCIEVRPDSPGTTDHWAVLRAYDSGGNPVDETRSTPGVIETICVRGFRISSAQFSGDGNHYARFDNLGLIYHAGPKPTTAYIPGAANLAGAGGTTWKTSLDVHNRGGFSAVATVELLERDQGNPSPSATHFTIAPGESLHADNALQTVFGFNGAATLRVTGTGGALVATSRTYNDDPSGTFGQFVAGADPDDAIFPGQTATIIGLSQSANAHQGYRTNLGLVSASEVPISVYVELFRASGNSLGTLSYDLDPYESIQINKVYEELTTDGVNSGYAVVWSTTAQSLFFAFASVVDNSSGDGIYIPAG
ncbi:hypothetical protein DRQ32_07850 [bacterium]|nr:MAG: hypothetical protein DRQ32_07850 [bacterium]